MVIKHKLPRRRALAAVGCAAAIMLGSELTLGAGSSSAASVDVQQATSQNWSGYVVQSSSSKRFSSVSGSWVEPSVSSSSSEEGYAAFWVGLGGASQQSGSLEQVGTAAQDVSGRITYYAWYELVPSAQVELSLTIHPGDHMHGKVTVSGTTVTITLTDQTTGQTVTKTLEMADPDTSSAEWIAEAPASELADGSTQILPLADFGKVTFTNASATAGGRTDSISYSAWTVEQVSLQSTGTSDLAGSGGGFGPSFAAAGSQQTTGDAAASRLFAGGTSFTVTYSSEAATEQPGGSATTGSGSGAGYPGSGYSFPGYGYPGAGYGYPGA